MPRGVDGFSLIDDLKPPLSPDTLDRARGHVERGCALTGRRLPDPGFQTADGIQHLPVPDRLAAALVEVARIEPHRGHQVRAHDGESGGGHI